MAGNLQRDNSIQPRVAGLIHLAHPARANRREDLVRAEFVASSKGHTRTLLSLADHLQLRLNYGASFHYPESWGHYIGIMEGWPTNRAESKGLSQMSLMQAIRGSY